MYRWSLALIASLGLVLCIGLLGCDDDTPPPKRDVVKQDVGSFPDTVPWPDTVPQADQFVWPDTSQDHTIWPDSYQGTPFGCQSDDDCFGQKCCETPWGVKLCAPSCDG